MSELPILKDWFFLDDAATQLSRILDEEWSVRDVFQAALGEHLFLSWYVENKPALPASIKLPSPQVPEQPISDTTQAKLLRGAHKIVLDNVEINSFVGRNIRDDWLMKLIRGDEIESGMFCTQGFHIMDDKGDLWRPLEYRSADRVALYEPDGGVVSYVTQEGYYPKVFMPDSPELGIRRADLEKCIEKHTSLQNAGAIEICADKHPLQLFHKMEKLCFNEISIGIDPDNLILRVSVKEVKASVPFALFGLTKKNGVVLNRQGNVFMDMARNYCTLDSGVMRAIARLSRSMRTAFRITDAPFLKGKPVFRLSISKEIEAKRRALKRTTSYKDDIGQKNERSAQDFLEDADPEFDPYNPIYVDDDL
ncbi:MAG: hypothetical protein DRR42_17015 [Gammaproteobacteria bacterium]|nr:MAG: hypothetical protein DRR42_17015 [Gammaproteobacteria bacterium]